MISESITKQCVSEQGQSGILWTVFEGAPFTSRRIASFATADDARNYLTMLGRIADLESACRQARGALDRLMGDSDMNNDDTPEMMAMIKLSEALAVPLPQYKS